MGILPKIVSLSFCCNNIFILQSLLILEKSIQIKHESNNEGSYLPYLFTYQVYSNVLSHEKLFQSVLPDKNNEVKSSLRIDIRLGTVYSQLKDNFLLDFFQNFKIFFSS